MPAVIGLLLLGLLALTAGAEALVRGASQLAAAMRLSPLFIGLTLVAYGTSAPELVVSVLASLRDAPDLAVGNVVGSNIFNSGIVLGIVALITPIPCRGELVKKGVLLAVIATGLLALFVWGGTLARWEAAFLLAAMLVHLTWSYREPPRPAGTSSHYQPRTGVNGRLSRLKSVAWAVAGIALLALGGHWALNAAIDLANLLGVSQTLIGLTVVAAGTSLPELATSAVAALRHGTDIAVGNVLGSNIFNILGILGIAGVIRPLAVPRHIVSFDIPVALGFSLACVPIALLRRRLTRLEGGLFLIGYVVYCTLLIWRAPTVQ